MTVLAFLRPASPQCVSGLRGPGARSLCQRLTVSTCAFLRSVTHSFSRRAARPNVHRHRLTVAVTELARDRPQGRPRACCDGCAYLWSMTHWKSLPPHRAAGHPQCRPRANCDGCACLRPAFHPCVTCPRGLAETFDDPEQFYNCGNIQALGIDTKCVAVLVCVATAFVNRTTTTMCLSLRP